MMKQENAKGGSAKNQRIVQMLRGARVILGVEGAASALRHSLYI
jgi:hypothetical protein